MNMTSSSTKPMLMAASGKKPERYPVWFLRQAGRYLPEYQKIRSEMSFLELCRDPAKAAEVTIQPLKRFDLDAAIIFSDILIPPAHMGQTLTFDKGHGPVLKNPVRNAADLKALTLPDWEKDAPYTGEAISATLGGLNKHQTMIGFAGAPFTVASYMIEGSGTKTFSEVKKLMFSDPEVLLGLLDLLTETTVSYLQMQVKAGAEILMLFDSWAGQLFSGDYRKFILPSMQRLTSELKKLKVPLIYYSGQGGENLHEAGSLPMDVFAIDWRTSLARAIDTLQKQKSPFNCVQGNLDPLLLSFGSKESISEAVQRIKKEALNAPAHIFNVGHGVLPTTSPDLIAFAISEIRRPD